ncbi:MAG: hypothetical protein IJG32_02210 [Selenomonadaceae bacterium]|nr:hypothetical protein [Selenomonadaceae bacterium]
MFDIARRNEQGLLVYDREAVRNFFTEKENALDDEYMEKFRQLFDRRDRGEISQEECNRLFEELDDEYTAACESLYDEEFGTQASDSDEENFSAPSNFITA